MKEIIPKSRKDFRRWLSQHHTEKDSFWVVIFKKGSGQENLTAIDVNEECLCFGWIDSLPNKRDSLSFRLRISPRKPKGVWSAVNKKRIEKLLKSGQIAEPGLKAIEAAKKSGTWSTLEKSDQMILPAELKNLLLKEKTAKKNFDKFAPSSRRAILEWIYQAKTAETKNKRINETVRLARVGLRANHWQDLKKIKG